MVFVTGGTGFLGAELIDQLLEDEFDVRATKRASSKIPKQLQGREGLEWVNADLLDYSALENAFEGVASVYHCAALVSYAPADHHKMLQVNVEGTANVVNLCLEHSLRLVHVSSIATLSETGRGTEITENDLWEYGGSQSGYSVSKYESEMEVWRGFAEGLNGVIVNPSLIIGAAAGRKGSGKIFYLLHKGLTFYPSGSVGLVDVCDVARAMILLMGAEEVTKRRFIINHENLSHKELLSRAAQLLGRPAPRFKVSPFLLEIGWRAASMLGRLSGRPAALTKESARISSKKLRYSNAQLQDVIKMEFKPLSHTLEQICAEVKANI